MSDENNPVEELSAPEPQEAPATTDQAEPVEQTEESAEPEVEYVEVERNGKKFAIPKELEPELLMHADYTRKTQQTAEERKQFEAIIAAEKERLDAAKANVRDHGQLAALETQLEQYGKVDWQQLANTDPGEAQKHWIAYQQAKDQAQGLKQKISEFEQRSAFEAQQNLAKQIEQAEAIYKREIKEWSIDHENRLANYAMELGAKPEQLRGAKAFPWLVRLMDKAMRYDQSLKQASKPEAEAPKPKPVTTISRPVAKATKDPDKMSVDEWLAWRNGSKRVR